MPADLLSLPSCAGWVPFALAAACWRQASEEAAERIHRAGLVFPVVDLAG